MDKIVIKRSFERNLGNSFTGQQWKYCNGVFKDGETPRYDNLFKCKYCELNDETDIYDCKFFNKTLFSCGVLTLRCDECIVAEE